MNLGELLNKEEIVIEDTAKLSAACDSSSTPEPKAKPKAEEKEEDSSPEEEEKKEEKKAEKTAAPSSKVELIRIVQHGLSKIATFIGDLTNEVEELRSASSSVTKRAKAASIVDGLIEHGYLTSNERYDKIAEFEGMEPEDLPNIDELKKLSKAVAPLGRFTLSKTASTDPDAEFKNYILS